LIINANKSQQVARDQLLGHRIYQQPKVSSAVAPRTASSPGSPNATGSAAFLPSMVNSTAEVSLSSVRPSAWVKGRREKALTPSLSRTVRGIQDKVAPVS